MTPELTLGVACYNKADCAVGEYCSSAGNCTVGIDTDDDGVPDDTDNCPNTQNPDQDDADGDGIGDLCDTYFCIYDGEEICADNLDNDCDGGIDEPECYSPGSFSWPIFIPSIQGIGKSNLEPSK